MKYSIVIAFLFALVMSCTHPAGTVDDRELKAMAAQQMDEQELVKWQASPENPQRHSQQLGSKIYELTYLPAELLAIREAGADATPEAIQQAKSHYTDLAYFALKVTDSTANGELLKQNLSSSQEYQRRVNYCSFAMQRDLSVVTSHKDSLACLLLHFERSFDVAPVVSFLLAFDKSVTDASAATIIFDDNLFGNGRMKFSFTREELHCTPQLKK